jgi:hypothetical protein
VQFTAVAFPPHLKKNAPADPDSVPHVPIDQVLGDFLHANEAELIDEGLNAVAEDLTSILDIVVRRHAEMSNEDDALWELHRLADHSERHCDMARAAVEAASSRMG